MISLTILAAEGLAQLGCGLGAGIATIGAGLGIGKIGGSAMDAIARRGYWQDPDQHDSDISIR